MKIDKETSIAGIPIKLIRAALHRLDGESWPAVVFSKELSISVKQADALITELLNLKFLEHSPPENWAKGIVSYRLGEHGTRLKNARFIKRIGRDDVDVIVSGLLQRAKGVNCDPDLCEYVAELHLFGSAIDPKATDFGDVDIGYRFGRRKLPPNYGEWNEWPLDRAGNAGFRGSYLSRLCYGERELLIILKSRNRYLSFHPMRDVAEIGTVTTLLFAAQPDDIVGGIFV